jgi:serine protease Do
VTAGIVSAKGRDGVGLSTLEEYIQTDAAINPGNSGGPLVNLDGKVVGINSGIASRDGGNMGVGFAIPAHVVQRVASAIASGTQIRRGWLGVSMQELDRDLAASFGHSTDNGVLVSAVLPGTPASRAGIESGDIIVAIDGAPAATPATMMRMIATREPQARVTLALLRAGERVEVQAILGERPHRGRIATDEDDTAVTASAAEKLGIEVQDLDAETAAALQAQQPGVVIASTLDGGPAAQAGLQAGDVIREVNGSAVRTVAQLQTMLERAGSRGMVRILIEREGSTRFTMVKPIP